MVEILNRIVNYSIPVAFCIAGVTVITSKDSIAQAAGGILILVAIILGIWRMQIDNKNAEAYRKNLLFGKEGSYR